MTIKIQNLDNGATCPALVIGDIHGCFTKLRGLVELAKKKIPKGQELTVVLLGDLVDRGPHSSAVLDWLLTDEPKLHKHSVMGNHDEMFLSFLTKPKRNHPWLKFGGIETIRSYGIEPSSVLGGFFPDFKAIKNAVPQRHVELLRNLPHIICSDQWMAYHACFDPHRSRQDQTLESLLWGRLPDPNPENNSKANNQSGHTPTQDKNSEVESRLQLHGHFIVDQVDLGGPVINLDTGAFQGGALSGLLFEAQKKPELLQV